MSDEFTLEELRDLLHLCRVQEARAEEAGHIHTLTSAKRLTAKVEAQFIKRGVYYANGRFLAPDAQPATS